MTTATQAPARPAHRSAYPKAVEDLLPQARKLATALGVIPSRNRLMSELRVGAPKANAVRQALSEPAPAVEPAAQPTSPADEPAKLQLLPGIDTAQEPTAAPASEQPSDLEPDPGSPIDSAVNDDPQPAVPEHGSVQVGTPVGPDAGRLPRRTWSVRSWPVLLLAAPAFVAIWSGWVGLGGITGFGVVHPLPGIWDGFRLNTAITLPIGVETYAAYALRVWLSGLVPACARRFAKWSAIGSLGLGALGQVAYHLMATAGTTAAPTWITTLVACLPVAVLGMGAALAHLLHAIDEK